MTSCPTCKRPAKPKARYCPACYFVFPSDSLNRNLAATRAQSSSWRGATLFFVVMAGVWVLQLGLNDPYPEPGSIQESASNIRQDLREWVVRTIIARPSADARPAARASGQQAAGLDNSDLLPCAIGAECNVVIRFASGTASYVIDRSGDGARILADDPRGTRLLNSETRGELVVARPRQPAQSVTITRQEGGRWSVVGPTQLSITDITAAPTGRLEGAI